MEREFSQSALFGERIGHGLLVSSLISGLASALGSAERTTVAVRRLDLKFKKPVLVGDTIRAEFEMRDKRSMLIDGAGLVFFKVVASNQDGQTLLSGKWSKVIKKKTTG